ncbi:MAG: hypothetical protein PVF96_00340 [Candidatus Bathyarchaeota archaeon]|jgi:hypothetical protein
MKSNDVALVEFRGDRRGVSPAISTVILTGAVVVLLLVTVAFANNFLNTRMAEDEFSATIQFMQTIGLQVDDVAWTIGRTQTARYASNYGHMNFESLALNYTIYVNDVPIANYCTGILMFNMPIGKYSVGNNYCQRIVPTSDSSFLQQGTAAPITHVYVIEKAPMNDGNYIRIIAAPSIRMLNSTVSTGTEVRNYFKLYLPVLSAGSHPRRSQTVTLSGKAVSAVTEGNVNRIKVRVDFPKTDLGFDGDFFNFDSIEEEVNVPDGSVLEFYTGEVIVSLGLYT